MGDAYHRLERLDRRAAELESAMPANPLNRFVATQAALFAELAPGPEYLRDFHRRGLLSNHEIRAIDALLGGPELPRSNEDRRWFLHRAGDLWPTAACYLGSAVPEADWQATRSALIELVRTDADAIFAPPPLLDGHEIAELIDVEPGPRLGEVVGGLRRAQIEARVTNREAAVDWLKRLL